MAGLLDLLLSLTAALRCLGSNDIDLYRLRVWLTAQLILENPAFLPFEQGDFDGDYIAPAEEGERLAAQLAAAGQRIVVVRSGYHDVEDHANQLVERIGPFWTDDLSLLRFDVFSETATDWIALDQFKAPGIAEPLFRLPARSDRSPDGRLVSIAPGTVWIAAQLITPGQDGFVGLRVTEGELALDQALPVPAAGTTTLPSDSTWSIRLAPEQASGDGGPEPVVVLPELIMASDGTAGLRSNASVSTPLGAIDLAQVGAPFPAPHGIAIPLGGAGKVDVRAPAAAPLRLQGTHALATAALVLTRAVLGTFLGEARDGGTLALTFTEGESSAAIQGTSATLSWQAGELRLSASRNAWLAPATAGLGTMGITAWNGARGQFGLDGGQSPMGLTWTTGGDMALVLDGTLVTALGLPLAADGNGFDIASANRARIGIARLAGGDWVTTLQARLSQDEAFRQPRRGLTLANLYLCVRGPRRLLLAGKGSFLTLASGVAHLTLDALSAEPMLPDPYAANWTQPPIANDQPGAVEVTVRWDGLSPPHVRSTLAGFPSWPQPEPGNAHGTDADRAFADYLSDEHGAMGIGRGLKLIDLSSHAQRFGVELDQDGLGHAQLGEDAMLAVPLTSARLFLLPQVHWEPVRNLNEDTLGPVIQSTSQGMPAFAVAIASEPVRALPEEVARRIVHAQREEIAAAALFSLPFGQRAFTDIGPDHPRDGPRPARVSLHAPKFDDDLVGATQLRLEAQDGDGPWREPRGEARLMRGRMASFTTPQSPPGTTSDTLPDEVRLMLETSFRSGVPLHRVDLSGYGLSCFSRWRNDPDPLEDFKGVTQVRFDAMLGRTAYEVIQLRSYLACPQCRIVRTIVLQRTNAGVVERYDGNWVPIEDGTFDRYVAFETGLVRRFSRIRNITILDRPWVKPPGSPQWVWQAVLYDADAHLGDAGKVIPVRRHLGFIPLDPVSDPSAGTAADHLTRAHLGALFETIGEPMGGPVDAHLKVGDTLPFHATGIFADRAPTGDPANPAFVMAVYGTPALPRVGQWNSVRVAPDGAVAPVDPGRGLPVIRSSAGAPYRFREPADAHAATADGFGFLVNMDGSRLLFPEPEINSAVQGKLTTGKPELADAYALSQAVGLMPQRAMRLVCNAGATFALDSANDWKLLPGALSVGLAEKSLAGAAKWQMKRVLNPGQEGLALALDTAAETLKIERTGEDSIDLDLPGLPGVLSLVGSFASELGKGAAGRKPEVRFGGALQQLRELVDALDNFIDLPLPFDIEVNAVPGPTPAFEVRIRLRLRVPGKANERIDIGVGKFSGQFEASAQLRAALSGPAGGQLRLSFEGDLQQAIIPPVLFAGGYFRFAVTISDTADPVIELAFASTASVGGDLIKGLVELEVTVRYGYTLIPQTFEPGVLLGMEARAKLLSGLLGLSFRTDVLARVRRLDAFGSPDPRAATITIFAEIRVIATIEIAWGLVDDETELVTQFEQELPLMPIAILGLGANPLLLATELL